MILATGSVAKLLDLQFGGRILDTAGMWLLNEQPSRLAVIGAGASGTEIARPSGGSAPRCCCSRRSTRSCRWRTRTSRGLRARDQEAERADRDRGEGRGRFASDSGVEVSFNGEKAEVDYLVIAAGRAPDVEGLGLDEAGIERDDRGLIKVDGRLRTSRPGVWASATWSPGRRWPTRRRTRGSSRSRTRRARGPRDRLHVRAGGDVLLPAGGLVRADGEGSRKPAMTWWWARCRWAPWSTDRLRRPQRPGQDRRRQGVRRDPGRTHLLGEGSRPDPGARERPRARGRIPRGGTHDPPAPGVRRDGDGSPGRPTAG